MDKRGREVAVYGPSFGYVMRGGKKGVVRNKIYSGSSNTDFRLFSAFRGKNRGKRGPTRGEYHHTY